MTKLEKAKKEYEKAYKEAVKAKYNFKKADADFILSRAEVEKTRGISVTKSQMCEDCKTEYANQLQKTNELQRLHYNELMPKVFQQLQDMEERKNECLQNYIKQSAVIHKQVIPIISKCLDGIITASQEINPKEDSGLVIDRYKSGNLPPEDIPFEDLSNPNHYSDDSTKPTRGTSLTYSNSMRSETLRGTLSAARFKKRVGIFNLFGSSKVFINILSVIFINHFFYFLNFMSYSYGFSYSIFDILHIPYSIFSIFHILHYSIFHILHYSIFSIFHIYYFFTVSNLFSLSLKFLNKQSFNLILFLSVYY